MSGALTGGVRRRGVQRRSGLAIVLLLLLAAALGRELLVLRADNRYNDALAARDWATAALHESAHGRLAEGYRLHRDGRLDEAVVAYGLLGETDPEDLRLTARVDLATLYLERARQRSIDDDARVPLVELAKQLLREVLRVAPRDWDARYNLTRALMMVPDVDFEDLRESRNLERAPRAPQSTPAYEQLP